MSAHFDTECVYTLNNSLNIDISGVYNLADTIAEITTECVYSMSAQGVFVNTEGVFSVCTPVRSTCQSRYDLTYSVELNASCIYALRTMTPVYIDIQSPYAIYEATVHAERVIHTVEVEYYGVWTKISTDMFTMTQDCDSFCWSLNTTVSEYSDWLLCIPGNHIRIVLDTDIYMFVLDARNRTTSFGVSLLSITGRSPSALLNESEQQLTKTWGQTLVSTVVAELCGSVPHTYDIIDWQLPANVLQVEETTPLAILQRLATTPGGFLYTTTEGTLVLAPLYKVPPPEYDLHVDAVLNDFDDILEIGEERQLSLGYNQVEVTSDPEVGTTTSISILDISSATNTVSLRIDVYPFATSVELQHSYTDPVTFEQNPGNPLEETNIEIIEILDGVGNVSLPISSIVSSEYIKSNKGLVTFKGASVFTEIDETTLLQVEYTTMYHEITAIVGASDVGSIQFFMED